MLTYRLEAFPGSLASMTLAVSLQPRLVSQFNMMPDLPSTTPYSLSPDLPISGSSSLLRPPFAVNKGAGIFTSFPSATHFCLTLGADSPCVDYRCAGNLGLSACRVFTCIFVTHVSIRTSDTSSRLLNPPSSAYRTLPYHVHCVHIRSFGD